MVEGGNVVHRVKREGELSGEYVREDISEVKCPGVGIVCLSA